MTGRFPECEKRENQGNHADRARPNQTRAEQLYDYADAANRQQKERDVGIGEKAQEVVDGRALKLRYGHPLRVETHQFAVVLNIHAVKLRQKVGQTIRLQVDDAQVQRFIAAVRLCLEHGVLKSVRVALALRCDAPEKCRRVLGGFRLNRVGQVLTARSDGGSGSYVRRGRHRGDMRGGGDERAGRRGARARRRYIHDDRHRRGED